MLYIPMEYLKHMQNLPKADRKIVVYGIASVAAIAGGLAWLLG
ncbi:MAG: hypothetical protein QNI99_11585 [Woeseiaceae bacterium]|nr:hypothetical protein [Woeseiaceae bacterium]